MPHKQSMQGYAVKGCIAFLLVLLLSMGGWSTTPSFAHTTIYQARVVTLNDPIATFTVTDAESSKDGNITIPFPLFFTVKGTIKYTLDPTQVAPSGSVPQIKNIYQDVEVINGNAPNLPFSFTVRSSIDIENADGTYVKTITGQTGTCTTTSDNICYGLQDFSSTPTNTPYIPGSSINSGNVLFILKHNIFITTDNGGFLSTSPPYSYKVVCC